MKQYFESLLKIEIETIEIKGQNKESEEETERVGQQTYEPTLEEIRDITHSTKHGKAPGIDTITVELVKSAGEKMEQKIYNLIRKIWQDEQMPKDWRKE